MMLNKVVNFLVILLFFTSPFVMAIEESVSSELMQLNVLPIIITQVASVLRWTLLSILTLVFIVDKKILERKSKAIYLLTAFYFLQFLYAFVDGTDILRFFLLALFSFCIPPVITKFYTINNLNICCKIILFFLVLSVLFNGQMVLEGYRFLGFMNNPNTYGISALFWLIILLLGHFEKAVSDKLFYSTLILLILTIILSGSRNALIGLMLIVFFYFIREIKILTITSVSLIAVFFIINQFVNLDFLIDRFTNLGAVAKDSGREELWQRAYFAISNNFYWGNGMDANNKIVNSGNMHNSYVRFVLNMGIIFTFLSLIMYFLSISVSITKYKKVPIILSLYLIVYALMNLGEDFFVGIGSAVFLNTMFIYSIINYYDTNR